MRKKNMERRNQICYSSEIKLKVKEVFNPLMPGGRKVIHTKIDLQLKVAGL